MKDFSESAYQEMTEALFSRFKSFQSAGKEAFKPGLDRMEFFDSLAGHPHRKYRTIHIAGTNGKGSVSNMIASVMASRGLRTGLYTSPHILDFRERIRVVGEGLIPKEDVWDFITAWKDTFEHLDLSFFEITTMMAFDWFARQKVDVAVIETGLGGRMDSTNIITPELSVITNIGLDHCDLLGNTLPEIAFEKAGIIKPGVRAVIGESGPETDEVFQRKFKYTNMSLAEQPELVFADKCARIDGFGDILAAMDLQGSYQEKNLQTVITALGGSLTGTDIDAIIHTASRTGFHGRWERLCTEPEVICDIGHNAHGLKYNFAQLQKLTAPSDANPSGRGLVMVYGSVADKDVDAVLSLIPADALVIFTNAANHRAMPAEEVQRRYLALGGSCRTICEPDVRTACRRALSEAEGMALPLIYIGGSTYVVSEAVPYFQKENL